MSNRTKVIGLVSAVGGIVHGMVPAADDQPAYLRAYDPDAHDGRGEASWTDDIREALVFADAATALRVYRQASTVRPLRPDGKPNRPLTAFTVSIMGAPKPSNK